MQPSSLVDELDALFARKQKAFSADIVRDQRNAIKRLLLEDEVEKRVVTSVLEKIKSAERRQEFNLSLDEYTLLLKEKHVEENMAQLYAKDIDTIKSLLIRLDECVAKQHAGWTADQAQEEARIMKDLMEAEQRVSREDGVIKTYLDDMKRLRYDTRYISGVRVFSKVIRRALFRVKVEGLERIPQKGPCIIAPHHVSSAWDPPLLNAIIPRKLFYLSSVEPFVASKIQAWLYHKIGLQPFKREDREWGEVLPGRPREEDLKKYPSSNMETFSNILKYLRYGEAVVIFPEGDTPMLGRYKRNPGQQFIDPKDGYVTFAYLAGVRYGLRVPIVPIGIRYASEDRLGIGAFTTIVINIGDPVYLPAGVLPDTERKRFIQEQTEGIFREIKRLSLI